MTKDLYVGRFAPTPSGPLHFGSIIAALASFLESRKNNGKWLLRFDDIDTPRIDDSAYDNIYRALESLHMEWDNQSIYQKNNLPHYQEVIDRLSDLNILYKCHCPRKLIKGKPYPGTCRNENTHQNKNYALRVKVDDNPVFFVDLIQGKVVQDITAHSGDFIVQRSDRLFSYNLATAIDDASGITHVIRGADLLETTPRQIYLQKLLGLKPPIYGHVPIAVNPDGKKLSKQHGAEDVLLHWSPSEVLVKTLQFLGQEIENDLASADTSTIIDWAVENWSLPLVPKVESIMGEYQQDAYSPL